MNTSSSILAAVALSLSLTTGCVQSTHATMPSALGTPSRSAAMLTVIDQPGPIETETVVSTEWAVERSGLINLDAPKAKEAGLKDGDEPIEVFFHVLRHPRFGTYIIDTGVERAMRDAPDKAAWRGFMAGQLHTEKMRFTKPLGDWIAEHGAPKGVFFTHLHIDHVSGAPDLPRSTPLYSGPGETTATGFVPTFTGGTVDRALAGLPAIGEWPFRPDEDHRFAGVVDVFGDGSLWAIWTPGHTPGSTAYLARTPHGPVLYTGDSSHTRWGWEHDVEPGSYTKDHAANAVSLARLRKLAAEHPAMELHFGHQSASSPAAAPASVAVVH